MPFKIGDKVVWKGHSEITWTEDNPRPIYYVQGEVDGIITAVRNTNSGRRSFGPWLGVDLWELYVDETKLTKKELICRKVKYLEDRFKERKAHVF